MIAKTPRRAEPAMRAGDPDRESAARRLVDGVAAKDYRMIYGSLATDTRFRYLVPGGPGEVVGAAEVAAKYFQWFGDADPIAVEDVDVKPVADRVSARYRFVLRKPGGWKVIEQQTYLDVDEEGRITAIDLVCSGFGSTPVDGERGGSPDDLRSDGGLAR